MNVKGYDDLVEVGRGASAVVYQARQVAFDRTVALKVLVSSGLDDDARRRFDRECRAVGNLGWHPRVVPVYDAGVTDSGQPYLAMEFLRSGSLATRLKAEGPLSPQAVTTIGIQVADALEAAHHVGVLHRDVKPGNILTGHFGDIRLADFGIASISSANTSVTDALAGTLSFMAPELLNGDKATPGSDIYSLGSTLYLLLTGSAPYSSETDETPLATLMRITRDPVPDLRVRGIDDALASVIEKAMAKDPANRYQRASEMIDDLAGFAVAKGWPAERVYSGTAGSPDDSTDGDSPNPVDDIDPIDGPTVRRVAPSVAPTIDDLELEPQAHSTAPQASTDATSVAPGSVARGVDDRTVRRSATPAQPFPSTTDPTGEATAATPPPARETRTRRKRYVIGAAAATLVAVAVGAALQLSNNDGPGGVRALEDVAHACDLITAAEVGGVLGAAAEGPFGADISPVETTVESVEGTVEATATVSLCGFTLGSAEVDPTDTEGLAWMSDKNTGPGSAEVEVSLMQSTLTEAEVRSVIEEDPLDLLPVEGVPGAFVTSQDVAEDEPAGSDGLALILRKGSFASIRVRGPLVADRDIELILSEFIERLAAGLSVDGALSIPAEASTPATDETTEEPVGPPPWHTAPPVEPTGANVVALERSPRAEDGSGCTPLGIDETIWSPPPTFDYWFFSSESSYEEGDGPYPSVRLFDDGAVASVAGYAEGENPSDEDFKDYLVVERPLVDAPGSWCEYRYGPLTPDIDPELVLSAIRVIES